MTARRIMEDDLRDAARLALAVVVMGAWLGPRDGVRPFLTGGVAKSAAAALIWLVIRSRMEPVDRPLYDET